MGVNTRHILSLMKKNFINWHRTWFGSLLEIVVPIASMVAICLFRKYSNVKVTQSQSLLGEAHSFYPITQLNGINWNNRVNLTNDTYDFLTFANITNSTLDDLKANPGLFFPQHCYDFKPLNEGASPLSGISPEKSGARNSTGIAYIVNGNRVELQFLDQLFLILNK